MIGVFHDIKAGIPEYYIAEEIEYEKGLRRFRRICGNFETEQEANKVLETLNKKGELDGKN